MPDDNIEYDELRKLTRNEQDNDSCDDILDMLFPNNEPGEEVGPLYNEYE